MSSLLAGLTSGTGTIPSEDMREAMVAALTERVALGGGKPNSDRIDAIRGLPLTESACSALSLVSTSSSRLAEVANQVVPWSPLPAGDFSFEVEHMVANALRSAGLLTLPSSTTKHYDRSHIEIVRSLDLGGELRVSYRSTDLLDLLLIDAAYSAIEGNGTGRSGSSETSGGVAGGCDGGVQLAVPRVPASPDASAPDDPLPSEGDAAPAPTASPVSTAITVNSDVRYLADCLNRDVLMPDNVVSLLVPPVWSLPSSESLFVRAHALRLVSEGLDPLRVLGLFREMRNQSEGFLGQWLALLGALVNSPDAPVSWLCAYVGWDS